MSSVPIFVPLSPLLCRCLSLYLKENKGGESDAFFPLPQEQELYLLLEACVCVSPEVFQHGYIWAGSRNSIDGWVTVSSVRGRTQAV